MPLDPQIKALFGGRDSLPALPASVEAMRGFYRARELPGQRVGTVATVEDRKIEGETRSIGIRIYSPSAGGLFPLMVYFHGGGFIAGDLGSHDVNCRNFCAGAQCVVMSVDYRLAPEHKFPAATDDCLYATRWASQHASEMRADPDRIVVAGDSAGANLAAVTAMRIRDEGGPSLAGQLLLYPVTDHPARGTASLEQNAEDYLLTRKSLEFFWAHYLNDATEAENPFAAPLRASILTHLPPTMLITAEYDPLRDEGERYGRRLQDAGVRTTALRYDGMIHGFLSLTGIVDKADVALTDACGWLEDIFTDAPGSRLPARQ